MSSNSHRSVFSQESSCAAFSEFKSEDHCLRPVFSSFVNDEYHAEYADDNGGLVTVSITSGTITSGTYSSGANWYSWSNALVSAVTGSCSMSFRASFNGSQYDAGITSVSSGSHALAVLSTSIAQHSYNLYLYVPSGSFNPLAYVQY